MEQRLRDRLQQLQTDRQQVAAHLQTLLGQVEQARHMLSAYDGAIGELTRLLEEAAAAAETAPPGGSEG